MAFNQGLTPVLKPCDVPPDPIVLQTEGRVGCLYNNNTGEFVGTVFMAIEDASDEGDTGTVVERSLVLVASNGAVTEDYVVPPNHTLGECRDDETDRELICYVTDAQPEPQLAWARHDDALLGVVAPNVDPAGIAYFTATNPVAPLILAQVGLRFVDCSKRIVTEIGCLSDPASVDLSSANRCNIEEVVINGNSITVMLDEGWTVAQFVEAVNAAEPDTLAIVNGNVVALSGQSLGNMQIVCTEIDFTETFGTRTGALNKDAGQPIGQPPMDNPGATTTYVFAPNGMEAGANRYSIIRVADMSTSTNPFFNMGNGAAAVDSQGDADGLVYGVNGSPNPGTMYAQVATGLVVGQEYQMRAYYADANGPANPNQTAQIALRIFDATNTTQVAENDIGFIPNDGEWHTDTVRFVANSSSVTFRADNASPILGGNDVFIDHITFARVERTSFLFEQNGEQIPVEIVKTLNDDNSIISLRVWSADGQTEYPLPDPDERVLSTGSCHPPHDPRVSIEKQFAPVAGCITNGTTQTPVAVHFEYNERTNSADQVSASWITDQNGDVVVLGAGDVLTIGECQQPSDGEPVAQANYQTTVDDILAGQTFTILPSNDLISWTLRNRNATTATFQTNGGTVLDFDPAESISSGNIEEEGSTLNDTVVVSAGDGIIRVMVMRRL